mgnify:CR=1 FL=1
MKNYLKTFIRSIFVVTIKLLIVNLILATLLGIFIGGCYLLFLAIGLMGTMSIYFCLLHLLGGVCVLILIIPVFLKIWNAIEKENG